MRSDPTHEAERFISLLWADIYARVRAMLHQHHREHEPGGKDQLRLRLGELWDCYMAGVSNGQAPIYNSATGHYEPGSAGGGGAGQAFFEMVGALYVATVPGPTNLTGGALTITRVRIKANGACTGSAAGQSFSFGAGGGTNDNTGLTTNWADGDALSATVATVGTDGTYLTVDVYFTV